MAKRFQGHQIRGPKTMWCNVGEKPKVAKPVFTRTMEMVLEGVPPVWHCSNCGMEGK